MIRKLLYFIFSKLIPEINILRKKIAWNEYADHMSECKISPTSSLFSPFCLQNVVLGDYSYISRNSYVSHVNIGKFCSIGPNLLCGWGIHPINGISTSPSFYSKNEVGLALAKEEKVNGRKVINIGNDVFIGANVTILDGVTIGDGAVIGAGAVVSKDIPPYAIAVGSPIQIIKYRFDANQIEKLLEIKWWDFEPNKIVDVEKLFFEVDDFIVKYAASKSSDSDVTN